MSVWGRIFAACYDRVMEGTEKACLRAHREALIANAHGDVLEIGGGTGANLGFYSDRVEKLTVTEPEAPMAKRLARHLKERELPAQLVKAPAEELPFEDGSFDVAVSTLVLCTVRDPVRALSEIERVLRPGGNLLFLEHVYLDGSIVSMTFGQDQTIPSVTPGQHVLRVEFVASDHRPFDPRVITQIVFEVRR